MGNNTKGFEFKKFATPRIIGGIAIVIIVLWALSIIFGTSDGSSSKQLAERPHDPAAATSHSGTADQHQPADLHKPAGTAHPSTPVGDDQDHTAAASGTAGHETAGTHDTPTAQKATTSHGPTVKDSADEQGHGSASGDGSAASQAAGDHHGEPAVHQTAGHGATTAAQDSKSTHQQAAHQQPSTTASHGSKAGGDGGVQHGAATGHPMPSTVSGTMAHKPRPKGVAFVEATIKPLHYELEERWWGWRPNDIIDLTDNVNNYQMGVLEVTRRATVALAERISRTGTTDAFDENLEQAMNWFMIKASSFWFPSAESKYREGLEELQAYLEKLDQGNATFYTRTDNLIPLLASFEDLMGSCDENLVKQVNDDGTPLSSFAVDNYFFYTQGVANSMATVLEAVHHDFLLTLESRNATELLHHAIVSCQRAAELDPWLILDSDYSSIFANHRANMAAPISHARFYLGLLIKTLST